MPVVLLRKRIVMTHEKSKGIAWNSQIGRTSQIFAMLNSHQ